MRLRSLFLRAYLGCIIVFLVIGISTVVVLENYRPQREMRYLSTLVMKDLLTQRRNRQSLSAELAWIREYPLKISVYDDAGVLIGSTVSPPLPMVSAALLTKLTATGEARLDSRRTAYAELEAGQLVAVAVLSWDRPWYGYSGTAGRMIAGRLIAWFVGFLIFAAIFARYLVKPLQHLASTVRRFGSGDLSARAGLSRSDEIGEVGRAFDEMADRVRMLIAAQQELMANVSHELQTPIARIHVALEHIAVKGLEKAKELLPEIELDVAELQRLFDDVMMVARLDLARSHERTVPTPLRLETLSVEGLIQKAAVRFRAEYQSHELVLDVQPGLPEMAADGVLLRRVIENLIDNARKYSEPGSQIRVAAAASREAVMIEIADQGIGIDEADLRQVFTPFFRSDRSRARQTGGVGLGLALARRVVEAHGGKIEITSTVGRGTTAAIKLPRVAR